MGLGRIETFIYTLVRFSVRLGLSAPVLDVGHMEPEALGASLLCGGDPSRFLFGW